MIELVYFFGFAGALPLPGPDGLPGVLLGQLGFGGVLGCGGFGVVGWGVLLILTAIYVGFMLSLQ
ncbi:MAG: hypothetical protein GC178_10245 [Flavobacteriales bacterium]|nr:hypothetical protein [Flavobacteriales bacterium]